MHWRNNIRLLRAALSCAALSSSAAAHDFWVEPASFRAQLGQRLNIALCIGDPFGGWSMARNAQRVDQFIAVGPNGVLPIVGVDGTDPAGVTRFVTPGGYVVGYSSKHAFTELTAAKFDEHLTEKGLDRILAQRRRNLAGQSPTTRPIVREAYTRYAKSLLQVAAPDNANNGEGGDRLLGFRLELLAENSNAPARGAGEQQFRLLYEGKPLSGALIKAVRRNAPEQVLQARSDAYGRVRFFLDTPDVWLIATVHMQPAPPGLAADWESLWASLSFEIAGSRLAAFATCSKQPTQLAVALRP